MDEDEVRREMMKTRKETKGASSGIPRSWNRPSEWSASIFSLNFINFLNFVNYVMKQVRREEIERVPARRFEDLLVWRKSHTLVLEIYSLSASFPRSEVYGLTAQLRRAAVSVPANIAEGFRKRGGLDKARFMNIAQGSLEEARYYLILARDLGYLQDTAELESSVREVGYLLDRYCQQMLVNKPSRAPFPPSTSSASSTSSTSS